MIVHNQTRKPIRVPLGKGKTLHLAPGGSGNVMKSATERAPFLKMLDRGDISVESEQDSISGSKNSADQRVGGGGTNATSSRMRRKGVS